MKLNASHRAEILGKYLPSMSESVQMQAEGILKKSAISVHTYRDIPINDRFWTSGPLDNRSWCFSLHSFAVLDALMSLGLWEKVRDLVDEWITDFGEPDEKHLGHFPWHDHATALRLDRLSVMRLVPHGPNYASVAQLHAQLLLQENFYSKHTNHGYDQALALLLASVVFAEDCDTREWARVGLSRLQDELSIAFNNEGVHIENSPAYHVGMTANLVRARLVLMCLGVDPGFDFQALLEKALLFTAWITRPDRNIAMLGDSTERRGTPPQDLRHLNNYKYALYSATGGREGSPLDTTAVVYPNAGYAIYRSSWEPWPDHVHLVFKSGFLSKYHRQDDDLNLLLHAFGEDWFIDSGLYNHNQADPIRIYMRSAMAHNIPYILDSQPRRQVPMPGMGPTLEEIDVSAKGYHAGFRAVSQMYRNVILTREVMVESEKTFHLIDRISHKDDGRSEIYMLFHLPQDKRVSVGKSMARVAGKNKVLTIRLAAGEVGECSLYRGMEGKFKSVYSPSMNVAHATQVLVFGPVIGDRVRFRLGFE